MIRNVHIKNYRSLRDVELKLEPLTVLVGANASGKSNFLRAIACKCEGVADIWARDPAQTLRVELRRDDGKFLAWQLHEGSVPQYAPPFVCQLLHLDLTKLRDHNTLSAQHSLEPSGQGLANVMATLPRKARDAIAQQFCALVPMFEDVDTRPSSGGNHRVVFQDRWQPATWYEPTQVSDGSIMLLAFLLLQHQVPAPDMIGIEEPERGLHPYLMGELVKVLRSLATGKFGKPIQVVLATHSAELLDFVDPKEVRFFSRSKDTGETKIETAPVDTPQWKKVFTEYNDSLSGVWLSGGLGGVP